MAIALPPERWMPLIAALARMMPEKRVEMLRAMAPPALRALVEEWGWAAYDGQQEPDGDWRVWLLMAGRGYGKTRAGSEWVMERVRERPGARVALVGGNLGEVERVMVMGRSGLLRVAGTGETPAWQAGKRILRFPCGAEATAFSAERPESLRGPEHHFAWCDELAKWPGAGPGRARAEGLGEGRGGAAWDNLLMGLRVGTRPRLLVTTTPRPTALLRRIRALAETRTTRGRTMDNVVLAAAAVAALVRDYGGTRIGRQELEGEMIEDVAGALWTRAGIEAARGQALTPTPLPETGEGLFRRIVVGVDPPASAEGTCGISVCGVGADGVYVVLADASESGLSPEGWARRVAAAAAGWAADRVVAEANNGGAMVESVLRGVAPDLPVRLVHASRGKSARAEPIAALFESGRARFAGTFPALEDELAGLVCGGGYEGPGASPDRADAMVWAMTDLWEAKQKAAPRVRQL
jgi:phage terminase large subunit-like protein